MRGGRFGRIGGSKLFLNEGKKSCLLRGIQRVKEIAAGMRQTGLVRKVPAHSLATGSHRLGCSSVPPPPVPPELSCDQGE